MGNRLRIRHPYFSVVVFVGYAGQHGWNIGIGAVWIGAAASKSPEMGVCAMAISLVIVPVVSLLTKNKQSDKERVEELFTCYQES